MLTADFGHIALLMLNRKGGMENQRGPHPSLVNPSFDRMRTASEGVYLSDLQINRHVGEIQRFTPLSQKCLVTDVVHVWTIDRDLNLAT